MGQEAGRRRCPNIWHHSEDTERGHFILIKETVNQGDTAIFYICIQLWCTLFHKHTLLGLKTWISTNPLIVGEFSTLLSPIGKSSRRKIVTETSELVETLHREDLAEICRLVYTKHQRMHLYLAAHGSFSNRPHPGTQNNSSQIQNDGINSVCLVRTLQ